MAITLYHVGRSPVMRQYDLDQFVEHYKTDTDAQTASTDSGVPQKGDAHPGFNFMFVTDRSIQESPGQSASIDITYTGCLTDDGAGHPNVPPAKNDSGIQVMSATANTLGTLTALPQPLTVQYYAPFGGKRWYTYGGRATSGYAPGVSQDIGIVSMSSIGNSLFTFSPSASEIDIVLDCFYYKYIHDFKDEEVVAGKYWLNTSRKIKTIAPFFTVAVTAASGAYARLIDGGEGYTTGDVLSVSGGTASATITVVSTDFTGGVTQFTASATGTASAWNLAASGGTGSGAIFGIIVLP